MQPLQFASYKGMGQGNLGAFQINLQRPHWYCIKKGLGKLKNYDGRFIPDTWLAQDPSLTKEDLSSREGCLFLEITSSIGKNIYDWDKKVTMALSITDISKILCVLEGDNLQTDGSTKPAKIMHDPGAQTSTAGKVQKWLEVSSPKGSKVGVIFNVAKKDETGTMTKHMVPLGPDEVKALACCLRHVIPICLAW